MKVTWGYEAENRQLARRSEIVNSRTLVAGIDITKRESLVIFVRGADRARLGKLLIPTQAEGILEIANRGRQLCEQHGLERVVLTMETTGH